ncbi:MAG: hypothetical protein JWP29_1994 [Rhodoferax sp.]|nr:hypothetical protein [Rhodoferax sp.]
MLEALGSGAELKQAQADMDAMKRAATPRVGYDHVAIKWHGGMVITYVNGIERKRCKAHEAFMTNDGMEFWEEVLR